VAILGLDIFCRDTIDKEWVANCLKSAQGDTTYLHWLLQAWGTGVSLALMALAVALFFGFAVGILRTTPTRWVVLLGDAWTELFRNIPLIVQLFLWYFVAPELVPPLKGVPGFVLAFIGLGLFTSARISEQVKREHEHREELVGGLRGQRLRVDDVRAPGRRGDLAAGADLPGRHAALLRLRLRHQPLHEVGRDAGARAGHDRLEVRRAAA
jgi:His/Glu/Gln/Arg/opine family amino acid ABC transporter permease subunit